MSKSLSPGVLAFRARLARSTGQAIPVQPVATPNVQKAGPWMSAATAAVYYDFPNPKAFRSWAARHHVIPAHMGRCARYAKRDIDAVMTVSAVAHGSTVKESSHGA